MLELVMVPPVVKVQVKRVQPAFDRVCPVRQLMSVPVTSWWPMTKVLMAPLDSRAYRLRVYWVPVAKVNGTWIPLPAAAVVVTEPLALPVYFWAVERATLPVPLPTQLVNGLLSKPASRPANRFV